MLLHGVALAQLGVCEVVAVFYPVTRDRLHPLGRCERCGTERYWASRPRSFRFVLFLGWCVIPKYVLRTTEYKALRCVIARSVSHVGEGTERRLLVWAWKEQEASLRGEEMRRNHDLNGFVSIPGAYRVSFSGGRDFDFGQISEGALRARLYELVYP